MHNTLRETSTIPCQNLTSAVLGWTEKAPIFYEHCELLAACTALIGSGGSGR